LVQWPSRTSSATRPPYACWCGTTLSWNRASTSCTLRSHVSRWDLAAHHESTGLRDKNASLEEQLRAYEGYERDLKEKQWAARLGALLQLLSSLAVGVGVNLSTPAPSIGGVSLILVGTSVAVAGIYVAYKD
jgi:hypothetical protein